MTGLTQGIAAAGSGLFDRSVPPKGYAWWYIDAISDDGEFALTLIVFVGSVFSPYYAWSGRNDPLNHCAVNVALYGRRHRRWAMTERGRRRVRLGPDEIAIGPSHVHWDGTSLTANLCETGMPLPHAVRGRVRLTPRVVNDRFFAIDRAGAHQWRPVAPMADVEVDFDAPALSWRGTGYFDMNFGNAPLEDAFRYWDWSRLHQKNGITSLSYTADLRSGEQTSHALRFHPDGRLETATHPPPTDLGATRIFGIRRRTHALDTSPMTLGATLEDTPFYSRSTLSTRIDGQWASGVHESLDADRLRKTLVKLMLPFRMPRRA